jgi:hypothetical protein
MMGRNGRQWVAMCGNRATLIMPKTEQQGGWLKSHKHHKSTESMVSGGNPKRETVPPGRQQLAVGVLQHDERRTPGRLLLGALSLGDTQDSSIGRFHHGGALVIWSPRWPWTSFGFLNFFEFLHRVNVIVRSGLWQARQMYLRRRYVRLSSQRVLRLGGLRGWGQSLLNNKLIGAASQRQ